MVFGYTSTSTTTTTTATTTSTKFGKTVEFTGRTRLTGWLTGWIDGWLSWFGSKEGRQAGNKHQQLTQQQWQQQQQKMKNKKKEKRKQKQNFIKLWKEEKYCIYFIISWLSSVFWRQVMSKNRPKINKRMLVGCLFVHCIMYINIV